MLVVFANNQAIIDNDSGETVITTDPVSIAGNNQAIGVTNVHRIFNPLAATGLRWKMQGSNDGQTWVNLGPESVNLTAPGTSTQSLASIAAAYARVEIKFTAAASAVGAAMFDIHVNFDHT